MVPANYMHGTPEKTRIQGASSLHSEDAYCYKIGAHFQHLRGTCDRKHNQAGLARALQNPNLEMKEVHGWPLNYEEEFYASYQRQ